MKAKDKPRDHNDFEVFLFLSPTKTNQKDHNPSVTDP